jgi:calcineurin-like phosphoesterase family protein
MTSWFSSDPHFWHENIIRYCNRPFQTAREMNAFIVARHNELVKPTDHWSCLGDVTMRRGGKAEREEFINLIRSMHGHKRLYLGNHDHWPVQVYLDAGFEKIYATWRDQNDILFSHIPVHPTALGSAIANVHGHIHQNKSPEPVVSINKTTQRVSYRPYINICVEATDYMPVTLEQIKDMIAKERGEYEGVKVGKEVTVGKDYPIPEYEDRDSKS